MKKRKVLIALISALFFNTAILAFVIFGKINYSADEAPTDATININVDQVTGDLHNEIFGTGGGGLETDLFRPGMAVAYKNMGAGLIRMGSEGFLKEGFTRAIGPVESRVVVSPNTSEADPENRYPPGPDEWGKAAKQAGSELMTVFTFYDGSQKYLNQYVNLLEYMNKPVTTEIEAKAVTDNWQVNLAAPDLLNSWGAFDAAPVGYFAWLRKAVNGGVDPGPYNCKYWEIGNEIYGNWYPVSMSSNTYLQKVIEFSNALKAVDGSIKVGAVISGSEAESEWDKASPGIQIWDQVVTKGAVENALQCNFSKTCEPAIDFLIPHYYDAGLRGRDDNNTYELFNAKFIDYKLPDGSIAPVPNVPKKPIVNVKSVNMGPGTYTFTIEGQSVPQVEKSTNEYEYSKLQLRLIDDGGEGNVSADSNVILNLPGQAYETGILEVKSKNLKEFAFPGTITLTKPLQKYRMELLELNGIYAPGVSQSVASTEISTTLRTTEDKIAQSFTSNDKNMDSLIAAYRRSTTIAPLAANIVAEVYPDSGSDSPDLSGAPLATFAWEGYRNVGSLVSTQFSPATLTKSSQEKDYLAIGGKYWIVQHLDRNLTAGTVYSYGNQVDNYTGGSLKTSVNSGSTWQTSNVNDQYFSAQPGVSRHPTLKNIVASLGANDSAIIGLSEKEWFEGLALAANIHSDVSIKQTKSYFATANSELKAANPAWQNEADYTPDLMATEYAYLNWESSANLGPVPQDRSLFPAIHDANLLVSLVNNHFSGEVNWAVNPRNLIYRYQGSIISINGTQAGSVSPDDPNLYLYSPKFYMMKIMSQNHGDKTVATNIISPQYAYDYSFGWLMVPDDKGGVGSIEDNNKYYWSSWPGLMKTPVFTRPYLNGYSSFDQQNEKLYLSVVNSNYDQTITSKINISGFEPATTATFKTLNSIDDKGMESVNGFVTKMTAEMPLTSTQISVADASEFMAGDTIAIQSTSQGNNEYFKISSVDYSAKIIHLTDLNGGQANPKFCYLSNFIDTCQPFGDADIVRITGNVGITENIKPNVSASFNFEFPAHSITVLTFDKKSVTLPPTTEPLTVEPPVTTPSTISDTTSDRKVATGSTNQKKIAQNQTPATIQDSEQPAVETVTPVDVKTNTNGKQAEANNTEIVPSTSIAKQKPWLAIILSIITVALSVAMFFYIRKEKLLAPALSQTSL